MYLVRFETDVARTVNTLGWQVDTQVLWFVALRTSDILLMILARYRRSQVSQPAGQLTAQIMYSGIGCMQ